MKSRKKSPKLGIEGQIPSPFRPPLTGVGFLQKHSDEGETRGTRVESGQGRGESFKKHFVTNNTEMAEKTIFRSYYLPCLLSFVPSLSCLNPNVKNLPLSVPRVWGLLFVRS